MPESGEWFSPRTRPEMLTSDDPPIPGDKPELVRILPGPATTVGRATAPLRRLVGVVPAIGRRIVRVDADQPSRWQVVGMWTSGSAIVAATGLAVATVLGGAPSALTQPFHQLTGLPGIGNEHSQSDAVSSTDKAAAVGREAGDRSWSGLERRVAVRHRRVLGRVGRVRGVSGRPGARAGGRARRPVRGCAVRRHAGCRGSVDRHAGHPAGGRRRNDRARAADE